MIDGTEISGVIVLSVLNVMNEGNAAFILLFPSTGRSLYICHLDVHLDLTKSLYIQEIIMFSSHCIDDKMIHATGPRILS